MSPTETPANAALLKLGDTDQTVANPDEDVRGRAIKDHDGEDLGKVDDLLVDDTERRVRFLVAEHGGILGIGARHSFIPVDAITRITPDEVHVNESRERIAGAPRYDPTISDELGCYESIYSYYGFPPFWGAGYANPGFPYLPPGL
jgi:sporulation protein YlmC with PRC-barrel domain